MDKNVIFIHHNEVKRILKNRFTIIGTRETLLSIADQIITYAQPVVPGCATGITIDIPVPKHGPIAPIEWDECE